MKFAQIILTLLLAIAASAATVHFMGAGSAANTVAEGAYDRILRTGTLRCGYFVWPPLTTKDPATGQLGGLTTEFSEKVAAALELKIEWVQELSFGTYIQDISSGRFDAECAQGWPTPARAKYTYYSLPFAYVPQVAVVRTGETRFDADRNTMAAASVRIATIDGESSQKTYRGKFSTATEVSLPQTAAPTDLILNVVTGKADATFIDKLTAVQYAQANPDTIKIVEYDPPIHLIELNFTLTQDDKLRQAIDVATRQFLYDGTVEALLRKYEPAPGTFVRVTGAYKPAN